MSTLLRTLRFAVFTLVEYGRSGRILVEVLALAAGYYLLLRQLGSDGLAADYFFSTTGLFLALLMFYTTTSIMGLGDRPQGYLVLARRVGRGGYLLGLYLAALLVGLAGYGMLSLAVALLNPVAGLTPTDWLLGSLPLVLNIALLAALLTLLSPIVLTAGWRLLILAFVAIAFSGSLISGQTLETLSPALTGTIDILRTIFSTPLLPAFTGFTLSVTRDYSGVNAAIPLSQLSLTLSLLALALYAFTRRDLVFAGS